MKKTVLAAAGVDPSGGAGLVTDCAAIRATGCRPAAVPTVLTVQNSLQFGRAEAVSTAYLREAIEAVCAAASVGAVKIGAVKAADSVSVLAAVLDGIGAPPVILDPVFLSSTGGRLADADTVDASVEKLFPRAQMVTPNLGEAAQLTGEPVDTVERMAAAAKRIRAMGPRTVLIKGGHLAGPGATDVLLDEGGTVRILETARRVPYEVRGTGCALSSLIAGWTARGLSAFDAVNRAREQLNRAIRGAVACTEGPRLLGDFSDGLGA